MVAIIDYGSGNIFSLSNSLARLGADVIYTSNPQEISRATHVILPGVGEASQVMREVNQRELASCIKDLTVPVLGICVGMQILCSYSDEGAVECLGIFKNRVKKLTYNILDNLKTPHMGWNIVEYVTPKRCEWYYFVHSFSPEINHSTVGVTVHGEPFSSVLMESNFIGTQFHPEKSGTTGERFLSQFLECKF